MNRLQDGQAWVEEAWERSLAKTVRNAGRIGASFPHAANGGVYVAAEPGWWTAGPSEGLRSLILGITGFGGQKKQEMRAADDQVRCGISCFFYCLMEPLRQRSGAGIG